MRRESHVRFRESLGGEVPLGDSTLDKKQSVRLWHLVVRRETDSQKTIKYSLANAPAETFPERLAYMQGQRFFVERSFQDAKETAGMDHYQVRGWLACHCKIACLLSSTEGYNSRRSLPADECQASAKASIH
ncbi:MAG: hypothetical protein Q7U88_10720 [Desulfocapsaceae bacterium]|nr:hypothetical protein [Desulfocapsaceae bacterium]